MKKAIPMHLLTFVTALVLSACTVDIPQAYRGQEFHKTGVFALWSYGDGFRSEDPILSPGTAWVGVYDEARLVDCRETTVKETLDALTSDGVQFKLDVYVRYSAECGTPEGVRYLLRNLVPEQGKDGAPTAVSAQQVYQTYIRPALGEAVRFTVSPFAANDLNASREKILAGFTTKFEQATGSFKPFLCIKSVTLNNMDFPDALDQANVERAAQGILRDKAKAQMEVVEAETRTMESRRKLALAEGEKEAARIRAVGSALREYPEFLQFDMQTRMEGIYREAGAKGNLVIAAPNVVMPVPKK